MADTRNSAEFAFTHVIPSVDCLVDFALTVAQRQFDNSFSGWPKAWSFFVGTLQAAYTLTGYGMVAALCEEVRDPVREVPKAMGKSCKRWTAWIRSLNSTENSVLSVVAAAITGIVYLVSN